MWPTLPLVLFQSALSLEERWHFFTIVQLLRLGVARTIAQKITPAVLEATSLFQYGSKAGGISAFDLISRAAMLDGMAQIRGGEAVLPFVLHFCSQPSQYLWTDTYWDNHVILQGEGRGEQGDALMLYSVGQHGALQEVQDSLMNACSRTSTIFTLSVHPNAIYKLLGQALAENARIEMHLGKTQVWNRSGHMPPRCDSMQIAVQRVDPHECAG